MTTTTTSVSDDQIQMLLIVVLVGAILYMLTQKSGGICSLVNPRETFALGALGCGPFGCSVNSVDDQCHAQKGEGVVACSAAVDRKVDMGGGRIERFPGCVYDEATGSCVRDKRFKKKGSR